MKRESRTTREVIVVVLSWLAVSATIAALESGNISTPGLYYDEATPAGLAADFVRGYATGPHMPGTMAVDFLGRPWPLFIQPYYGAVKSWLAIPGFMLFGRSVETYRWTSLCWYFLALLFFMLWVRKLMGMTAVFLATPLLALDPSFFFPSVWDWGSIVPGVLSRFCLFYFSVLWFRRRRTHHLLAGAFFLGLGFLHKVDFIVILLGCGIAVSATYGQEITTAVRAAPKAFALAFITFLTVISPLAVTVFTILKTTFSGGGKGIQLLAKIHTIGAMYDGEYILRLMKTGGAFKIMFWGDVPVPWSTFALALLFASVFMAVRCAIRAGDIEERRRSAFLMISTAMITLLAFLLPGGVGLHHATLVYPFPHLLVVSAMLTLWKSPSAVPWKKWAPRAAAAALASAILFSHVSGIVKTQKLIAATGGRGKWSESLMRFIDRVKRRTDLEIVSVDWGFNEQLEFLVDGPAISELFWSNEKPSIQPNTVYLLYPPEYSTLISAANFLNMARGMPADKVLIVPYRDRQGAAAFYAVSFP